MNQFKFFEGYVNNSIHHYRNRFVFFRGYIGSIDMSSNQSFPTASLAVGHGFTVHNLQNYTNQTTTYSNGEMERWYAENRHVDNRVERLTAVLDLRRDEITERLRELEGRIRLFQATEVVTVNPTPWTKFKIFGTRVKLFFKEIWRQEPIGLFFVLLLMCVISFIGIMKLLGY